jgi:hypothetical protein
MEQCKQRQTECLVMHISQPICILPPRPSTVPRAHECIPTIGNAVSLQHSRTFRHHASKVPPKLGGPHGCMQSYQTTITKPFYCQTAAAACCAGKQVSQQLAPAAVLPVYNKGLEHPWRSQQPSSPHAGSNVLTSALSMHYNGSRCGAVHSLSQGAAPIQRQL